MKIRLVHTILEIHFLYEQDYLDFFSPYMVEEGTPTYTIFQDLYSEDVEKGDLKITSKNYQLYVKDQIETQYQFAEGKEEFEGKIVYDKDKISFSTKDVYNKEMTLILLQYIASRILSKEYACVLMQGSAFSLNGKGILLTGSYFHEQKELMEEFLREGAVVINDIRNYIVKEDDQVFIYGNPWSKEKEWQQNVIVPLTHVISLMSGQETICRRMDKRDAFLKLMGEAVTPQAENDLPKWNETIDAILSCPCYLVLGKNPKKIFAEIKKEIL